MFLIFVSLLIFDTDYAVDIGISIAITFIGIFNIVGSCIVPSSRTSLSFFNKEKESDDVTSSEDQSSEISDDSEHDVDEYDGFLPQTYNETHMMAHSANTR